MILQPTLTGEYVYLFLWGIFGMILLSVAIIAFFVVYQRKIFAQERLRGLEKQTHQQELLSAAVEVQESERRRIARDLHDDIGSLLTATRLYLRQLTPDSTEIKVARIRDSSLGMIDDMIANTRRISHDLLPPSLEKFGFQAAAEDLCERIESSEALTVHFQNATADDLRLASKKEVALYRILQELLTNTIKHAAADEVTLRLATDEDNFSFHYTDDGVGFSAAQHSNEGLGLRNIESRVSVIGGHVIVNSSAGIGVHYAITLPILSGSTSIK